MYDGLVSTPEQLRYEQLCAALTKMADLVAVDEDRSKQLMKWVELQTNELLKSKRNHLAAHGLGGGNVESFNIFDPKCTKRKGTPRKLRMRSSLEMITKKSRGRNKVSQNSTCLNKCSLSNENVSSNLPVQEAQVMTIASSQVFETQDNMEVIRSLQ